MSRNKEIIRQPEINPEYLDAETNQDYFTTMESRWATLSEREKEIAKLFTEGQTRKQIGGNLSISEKTVEAHKNNFYRKLGVTDASGLAKAVGYLERKDVSLDGNEGDHLP